MFDSKLEGARYKILKEMQDRGEICDLEVQVPYECVVEGKKSVNIFPISGIDAGKMSS